MLTLLVLDFDDLSLFLPCSTGFDVLSTEDVCADAGSCFEDLTAEGVDTPAPLLRVCLVTVVTLTVLVVVPVVDDVESLAGRWAEDLDEGF